MSHKLTEYFENCLYFTSGNLYRQVEKLAFFAFSGLNIAPSKAFLMMAVNEQKEGASSPSSLAELMRLDKSTVTRLISGLEKDGYVKRSKKGRHSVITLTAKGRALLPKINECWEKLYDSYVQLWGEKRSNKLNGVIFNFLFEKTGGG
jgi:DNA-binding MarR family transcriptional regulator